MNHILFHMHRHASKITGKEKSCERKRKFDSEEDALKASKAHNQWAERKHDVESYPCYFCHGWHIGQVMPLSLLVKYWLRRK